MSKCKAECRMEYITKDQALEAIKGKMWPGELEAAIKAIPAANVAPLIYATTSGEYLEELYCSWKTCGNCKGDNQSVAKYCNWCGARLDGGRND